MMGSHKIDTKQSNKKQNSQTKLKSVIKNSQAVTEKRDKLSLKAKLIDEKRNKLELKAKLIDEKRNKLDLSRKLNDEMGTRHKDFSLKPITSINTSNVLTKIINDVHDKCGEPSKRNKTSSNKILTTFDDIERKIFEQPENIVNISHRKVHNTNLDKKVIHKANVNKMDDSLNTSSSRGRISEPKFKQRQSTCNNKNKMVVKTEAKVRSNLKEHEKLSKQRKINTEEHVEVKIKKRKLIDRYEGSNEKISGKSIDKTQKTAKGCGTSKKRILADPKSDIGNKANKSKISSIIERTKLNKEEFKDNQNIGESSGSKSHKSFSKNKNKSFECDSDNDVNFKEIDELEEILNAKKVEQETIQIELESTNVLWGMTKNKRKSEKEIIENYLRLGINRRMKEIQENAHKTHVLCLIAHGRYVNSMLNSEDIMTAALSIINNKKIYPEKRLSIGHLELVIKWYRRTVELTEHSSLDNLLPLKEILVKRFKEKEAHTKEEFTLMFIALLRVLGINCRLVYNLVPLSWKININLLIKPKKLDDEGKDKVISEKVDRVSSKSALSIRKRPSQEAFSSDSDFSYENKAKRVKSTKPRSQMSKSFKPEKSSKKYLTYWIEVYTEEEEEWISIDVFKGGIHHSSEEFESKLPPLCGYILAYNNDLTIKDVTKRYVHNWLSCKAKVRFDNDWWKDSISPFRGTFTKRDAEEDKDLDQFLEKQPLPKTLSSYKNHTLYALQRHLLKFEALYPPDVEPVGFFRGEPVFPRECVKLLHAREKWIKEGKTVKVEEEPYKIVKARPKWDKMKCQMVKDLPLQIFGEWQVEDYEPPVAANGKVPRNEYGNVELFKPTMLPKGCVYLNVPGINKVARKLGIDCASAITGFDFHGGWTHPVCEGYVVCEEFQDILMDACRQEQAESAKREEEKRLREIYGKWKKLIAGIRVKARIKEKYGTIIEKDASERRAKKCKEKKPHRKIKQEEIALAPAAKKGARSLKIDLECSAVSAIQKQAEKTSMSADLHDSSEEEATAEEKQEKIRTILNWNPSSSQNPDLSGSDDDSDSSSGIIRESPEKAADLSQKDTLISNLSEHSLSEGSTTENEMISNVKPKKRSKRKRSRVSYQVDSDSDFTDSDDDKTFKPD